VAWCEKEEDWDGRGRATALWKPPVNLDVQEVVDYLGRPRGKALPETLSSAPVFVFLPAGQAATLPLETPPPLAPPLAGTPTSLVLQLSLPRSVTVRVADLPWSEGYAYAVKPGQTLDLPIHAYNFGPTSAHGRLAIERQPEGWELQLSASEVRMEPQGRATLSASLRVPVGATSRDGWVVLRADCGQQGRPVLAFRVVVKD